MSGFPYRARVQFKYDAVEASELSVNPAEVVDVEEKNDSGWCLAKTADGRSGWLPADYLEKIEDTAALAAANLSDAMATLQQVQQQMAAKNAAAPNAADSAPAKAVEEAAAAIKQLQAAGAAAPAAAGDKKTCAGCKKELAKAFVIAKEKHFHPECFVCTTCKSPLGGKPFIEKDGSFYCEKDYYTAFNPKCAHCDQVIQGQYISALDKSWHPDHFVCAECGEPFKDSQFHKHNDLPYCEKHYAAKFAQNCSKCGLAITGQVFEALDQKFHLDCFQCEVGPHKIGESASFHVYESKVYCPTHFEELFLQKCAECGKMIQGQYVKVLDSHFHVECWKCTTCKTHITSGNCSQKDGRFYCKNCFGSAPSGSSSGAAAAGGAAAAAAGGAAAASKGPSGAAPKAPSGAAPAAPKFAAPRAGDGSTTIAGTNIKVPQSIMAKVNAQAGVTEGPSVLDRKPNPQSSFVKPPTKVDDEPSVKTAEPAAKPGTIQWFVENDAKARGGTAAPAHVPAHELEGPDKLGFVSYVALKNGNFPKTLDTSRKEAYLSDEDFAKCFKLSRVAFDKLPAWKKKQLKMNLGIW